MNELDWCKVLWKLLDDRQVEVLIGLERRLWDGTRVDILTKNWAVEVDWASKWTEAIGQCQWYAANTERTPGVCLLVKDFATESHYIYRCKTVCENLDIHLWLVDTKKCEVIDDDGWRHDLRPYM